MCYEDFFSSLKILGCLPLHCLPTILVWVHCKTVKLYQTQIKKEKYSRQDPVLTKPWIRIRNMQPSTDTVGKLWLPVFILVHMFLSHALCKHASWYSPFIHYHRPLNTHPLTLNPIQQQVHPILIVTESCLIVLIDLAVQCHADLLGRLYQVISLCHRCLVSDQSRTRWTWDSIKT